MAGPKANLSSRVAVAAIVLTTPAGAPMPGSQAQLVSVVATEYQFSPDELSFKRGIAYRLHIENHGKELHEFTAPDFFKAIETGDPAVLNPDRTEILIHPGEAKDLTFVALQTGHYRLFCADHDWAGMTGGITVE
jgi:uncharacterized cupredoxin-like copper-binding protein